jgi:hypothetical protein
MANSPSKSWIESVTAVSTTVAATLLLGFLGTFKDLAAQAPLIQSYMQTTKEELSQLKTNQTSQSLLLAAMAKDYPSRDAIQAEFEKTANRLQQVELQQALLRQQLEGKRR